jgi:hypothetical protein
LLTSFPIYRNPAASADWCRICCEEIEGGGGAVGPGALRCDNDWKGKEVQCSTDREERTRRSEVSEERETKTPTINEISRIKHSAMRDIVSYVIVRAIKKGQKSTKYLRLLTPPSLSRRSNKSRYRCFVERFAGLFLR